MLIISKDQYQQIELSRRKELIDTLSIFTRKNFKQIADKFEEFELRILLNSLINKSLKYHLTNKLHIQKFVELTMKYGDNFENKSMMKPVKILLERNYTAPGNRIESIEKLLKTFELNNKA